MLSKIKQKIKNINVVPGGLITSTKYLGLKDTFSMLFRMTLSYSRTFFYLLRKKGLGAALKFAYVKFFVPAGEGAGGIALFLLGPIIRKFPNLAPFPRYVEIEMTTICNKKCIICEYNYWRAGDQEKRHLTLEEFKHIVKQFPKLSWVNLTGEGSAFLNPDYLKMLRYLKSKNVPIFLVDHLSDLDEATIKELVEMGIDGIYVSMDGATKETYQSIKVGCSFENVIKNVKQLIKLKKECKSPIPEISFRYVITTKNYQEMPQFIELLSSLGSRKEFGDGSRLEFCGLLSFKEIEHLNLEKIPEEIINQTLQKKKKNDIHVIFGHSEKHKNPSINECISWMEPYIMMGGYVLPCCGVLMSNQRPFLRKNAFGNVFEKSFKEIWDSERYKRFRCLVNQPNGKVPLFCRGCRAYNTEEREKKYGVDENL